VRVLLSGGIGSGKSQVARMLTERDVPVFDADKAGHEALEPDGEAFAAVSARWPEVVTEGRIDRRALGRVVFGNPELLAELESYTHPAIRARLDRKVDALEGQDIAVVEMPLPKDFMGPGWLRAVVDADEDIRVKRLLARGMELDEIKGRMSSQPTGQQWRDIANYVMDNSGDLEHLDSEVTKFIAWMRGLVPRA
jgi:dephospho-CoA kinase